MNKVDPVTYLTLDDLAAVPAEKLPMMVISDNLQGLFGLLIKLVTKSFYSHFMWMHKPGLMATQSWWFHEALVTTFKKNSLKVFWCPTWTTEQRAGLIQVIESCLHKSWWETRYDVLGVIGQFLGLDWLQSDKYQYCSEHICKLALVDPDALEWLKTCRPTPEEVNAWLKAQTNADGSDRYPVYCRVVPG
jgi:hypothetical protein